MKLKNQVTVGGGFPVAKQSKMALEFSLAIIVDVVTWITGTTKHIIESGSKLTDISLLTKNSEYCLSRSHSYWTACYTCVSA